MFTGTPAELRRREALATQYATEITEALNKIDALDIGGIQAAPNKIAGPCFVIRRANDRWAVWTG